MEVGECLVRITACGYRYIYFTEGKITNYPPFSRTIAVIRITPWTIKLDILHPKLYKPDELLPIDNQSSHG